jgi:hypothetical protein
MTKEEELEYSVVYYVTTEDRPTHEWLMRYKNKGFVNLESKTTSVNNFHYYKVDTYTKATPSQIKHYEACMKAGKYVEVLEVGKWYQWYQSNEVGKWYQWYQSNEVGKWYQWYQSNHENTHIGKCLSIKEGVVKMSPWIVRKTTYNKEGSFDPSCMKEIIELPESEVQQYLPKDAEEWSEGTYVVALIDRAIGITACKKGDIYTFIAPSSITPVNGVNPNHVYSCTKNNDKKDIVKWFATLPEAEEFSKTLKEPVKYLDERGRPLKEFKIGSWYSNPKLTWVGLTNGNRAKFFRISKCDIESNSSNKYYYNHIWFDAHADSDWNIEDNFREQASTYHDQDMVEVFPVIKSERYIKTMEFFNQLREPEKSQAITNYDENYEDVIPDKLCDAVDYGFNWAASPERHIYWENICGNIRNSTYFNTKEAVHCPTQEEFDYVNEKLGYESSLIDPFDTYTTDSCIEIGFKCCGRKSDFKNYTILSFQEWCTKYNHEGLKPWVAQVGDWVYVIDKHTAFELTNESIVQCVEENNKFDGRAFTKKEGGYWLEPFSYRKATQAEIDSVTNPTEALGLPITKDVVWTQWIHEERNALPNPIAIGTMLRSAEDGKTYTFINDSWKEVTEPQWTHDNWYVEVSSQEEADMVIEAADKMYGKTSRSKVKYTEDWKYVSWFSGNYFGPLDTDRLSKSAKPRPISDFIPITGNIVSTTVGKSLVEELIPYQESITASWIKIQQHLPPFITQGLLQKEESFKVKSNPKLLDNNISKISSINISLKQKSKTKKL